METGELVFQFGSPGRGVLSAAVLVCLSEVSRDTFNVELAVDIESEAAAAFLSPDGAVGQLCALAPATAPGGRFVCTTSTVRVGEPGMIIEILDSDRTPIKGLSFAVRFAPSTVTPISRLSSGTGSGLRSWGPKGAFRFRESVQLIGAWREERFVALDLLVDDDGRSSSIVFSGPSFTEEARLFFTSSATERLAVSRLWVPADASKVRLGFRDSRGESLEAYECEIDLPSLAAVNPVDFALSLQSPAAKDTLPRECSGAGSADVDAEAVPIPSRPSSSPPGAVDPNLPIEEIRATVSPGPSHQCGEASGGSAEEPARLLHESSTSTDHPAAASTESEDTDGLDRWPDVLGEESTALGPVGLLTDRPVLQLIGTKTLESGSTCFDLCVDDMGVISHIVLASEGRVLSDVSLTRITPHGPVRVNIELKDLGPGLVLFCRNPYGEVFPNMVAAVDTVARTFRPFRPERRVWKRLLKFTEPLDLEKTLCLVCRRLLQPAEGIRLSDLEPSHRAVLRERFALTSDARGLCDACRKEHLPDYDLSTVVSSLLSVSGLSAMVQRLLVAYAGALVVLTPPGLGLVRLVRLDEDSAYAFSAAVLSIMIALLPWSRVFGLFVASLGLTRFTHAAIVLKSFVIPVGGVLAVLSIGGFGQDVLPEWYAGTFFKIHLHVAAVIGALVSGVAVLIMGKVQSSMLEARLEKERWQVQAGRAGCLIPRLLGVTTLTEYRKVMDRVLLEGFGVVEYQLFSFVQDEGVFRLDRALGPVNPAVRDLSFRPGDRHVLGLTARAGHSVVPEVTAGTRATGSKSDTLVIPCVLSIPILVSGVVQEIYNVSRVSDPRCVTELASQIEMAMMVAGRALQDVLASRSD